MIKVTARFPLTLISNPDSTQFAILFGEDAEDYDFIMPIEAKGVDEAKEIALDISGKMHNWVSRVLQNATAEDIEDNDDRRISSAPYIH